MDHFELSSVVNSAMNLLDVRLPIEQPPMKRPPGFPCFLKKHCSFSGSFGRFVLLREWQYMVSIIQLEDPLSETSWTNLVVIFVFCLSFLLLRWNMAQNTKWNNRMGDETVLTEKNHIHLVQAQGAEINEASKWEHGTLAGFDIWIQVGPEVKTDPEGLRYSCRIWQWGSTFSFFLVERDWSPKMENTPREWLHQSTNHGLSHFFSVVSIVLLDIGTPNTRWMNPQWYGDHHESAILHKARSGGH